MIKQEHDCLRLSRRSATVLLVCLICVVGWRRASAQGHGTQPEQGPARNLATATPVNNASQKANVSPQPSSPAPALTAADAEAFLDGVMPMQLAREDIAGAVVLVVKDGKVLLAKGYGYSDVKKRTPVSPDGTLFRTGSVSKLFTWTAVMQLVEQGKIDLNRDVNDYLDFKIPTKFGKPITVKDLMTHTPGFEETAEDLFLAKASDLKPMDEYLKAHLPERVYPPGFTGIRYAIC